jgi:hypothetical protein
MFALSIKMPYLVLGRVPLMEGKKKYKKALEKLL